MNQHFSEISSGCLKVDDVIRNILNDRKCIKVFRTLTETDCSRRRHSFVNFSAFKMYLRCAIVIKRDTFLYFSVPLGYSKAFTTWPP